MEQSFICFRFHVKGYRDNALTMALQGKVVCQWQARTEGSEPNVLLISRLDRLNSPGYVSRIYRDSVDTSG